MTSQSEDTKLLEKALDLAIAKCVRDGRTLPSFPHVTRDGQWLVSEHGRWTAGFFIGMLWLASAVREDSEIEALAYDWAKRLAMRAFDRSTHDMGFLFEYGYVRGFNLTGNAELRDGALQAARSLASRFHPRGRFIPAWSPEEDPAYTALAIVDTIMNVAILLWAGREADDDALWTTGKETAETIMTQHVRADGSTYHTVDHDPVTGAVTKRGTHQGAVDESCWSRGQAWALYGFTKVGLILEASEMMATATLLADYYLSRLGEAVVPTWDFDRPGSDEPRDSAAAAIAASGLLELGRALGDNRYTEAGYRTAIGLARTCVEFATPEIPGLLAHGSVDVPRNSGIDESIIYGDHFFMEALIKILRPRLWEQLGCVRWPSRIET